MDGEIRSLGGQTMLLCAEDGPLLSSEADALDLIGGLWGLEVDWLALPVARLGEDFLRLRTGLAGAVIQKFVNYRVRLAIVGDLSAWVSEGGALGDFVRGSNGGDQVWVVSDRAAVARRSQAFSSRL